MFIYKVIKQSNEQNTVTNMSALLQNKPLFYHYFTSSLTWNIKFDTIQYYNRYYCN